VTAADHCAKAESLAAQANNFQGHPSPQHVQWARLAQVHATLATVAPTDTHEETR